MTVKCAWFLMCERIATALRPHPVLGLVPVCKRCDDRIERLSR